MLRALCLAVVLLAGAGAAHARQWHYAVIDDSDYAPIIERFVNTLGPRPDGIKGALLNGREFHLWVREDQSGSRYRWECVRARGPWTDEVAERVGYEGGVLLGFNVEETPCLHMLIPSRGRD